MTTFVLVHGAFRGGWAWSRVAPLLVGAGHRVLAPSLLGSAELHRDGVEVLTLDTWVEQVVQLLVAEDLDDVVLVGHSQAGIVTRGVAQRVPHLVRSVVHLDAALTDPGERAVDLTPGPGPLPPRSTWIPARPLPADHFAEAGLVEWVNQRLTPTPLAPSLDVVAARGTVPEVVAFCSGTPAGYPSTVSRARMDQRGEPYEVLESGHDAPLEAPDAVAALLLSVVDSPEPPRGPVARG